MGWQSPHPYFTFNQNAMSNTNACKLIPLDESFSNIPAYVNSLFCPSVRAPELLKAAIPTGTLQFLWTDERSAEMTLAAWLAAWQFSQGAAYDPAALANCPAVDQPLIAFWGRYFRDNPLDMCIPQLTYVPGEGIASYANAGYQRMPFLTAGGGFDYEVAVPAFLDFILRGAHFVVVQAKQDTGGSSVENFYKAFTGEASLKTQQRHDPGNSHYASITNITGEYYPKVTKDAEPATNPLITAFLVGKTVNNPLASKYNAFFQLEGWEYHIGGKRHGADYDTYKDTLWNISTYGAIPYSEKRSTPIFLAPSTFSLDLDAETHMPLYLGADSLRGWMNPDLLAMP